MDYFFPTKPKVPSEGQELECPECKTKYVYQQNELRYERNGFFGVLPCRNSRSACFGVDYSDDCHAGNMHQPELVRASFGGLLQLVDGTLVPLDFCSPN
jgi:hypothetical protein